MMKQISVIPILIGVLFLLGSCVKQTLSTDGNIVEGESALVKLTMEASFLNDIPQTRAGLDESEENKYKDVRVMVFKLSGEVVTNYKEVYPTATEKPELTIKTYSGMDRSIYIIANVVDAVDQRLSEVQNLDQLNAIEVTAAEFGNGLSGKPLTMIGKETYADIPVGSTTYPYSIWMEFMVPKLSLKVIDNTPSNHSVTLLGWDIENAPQNSFLIKRRRGEDANKGKEDNEAAWLSTKDAVMSFDEVVTDPSTGKQSAYLTQYIFENRRAERVNHLPLPADKYDPSMNWQDADPRGKAWFAPPRATCIVIHAMHTTPLESRVVEARIYFGSDNHSNYDIARGTDYQFTVTVNGIDEIDIDTNLKPSNSSFAVHTTAPLDKIDAHPDFRPVMISAENGVATIEILDSQGRSHKEPGFDATWVKVSPLNLMYHQVRQAAPNDEWQQKAGDVGGFVRAKYIPHKSVRADLSGKGGWNTIPMGQEDDDIMTFAEATYRMCYKITDIPFDPGVVINKTLCVYTDEFLSKGGTRSAQIKISFKKNEIGMEEAKPIMTITQNGYLTIYDENDPDEGLAVLNEDGTPSSVKKIFGIEQYEEVTMQMNPGIDRSVQKINWMQWGFNGVMVYNKADRYRNGYLVTANAVYTDVIRTTDNRPTDFGVAADSYREMYGNNITGGDGVIPNYAGATSAPYYYPAATDVIYHPIYKSSAARYCHEKNRDLNGDGFIDASETKWYLPSQHELMMLWIHGNMPLSKISGLSGYWSVSEASTEYGTDFGSESGSVYFFGKVSPTQVRCVREL